MKIIENIGNLIKEMIINLKFIKKNDKKKENNKTTNKLKIKTNKQNQQQPNELK